MMGWKWLSPYGRLGRLHVLIYHRVLRDKDPLRPDEFTIDRFKQHCSWLKRSFEVLPLNQAFHRLQEGTLPPHAVSISFDDGYQDNLDNALPILKAFDLPASFFIATGFLDQSNMFNDTVIETVRNYHGVIKMDAQVLDCGNLEGKRKAIETLTKAIKPMNLSGREDALNRWLPSRKATKALMMTDQGVRQLQQAGMHLGAHTMHHPLLCSLNDEQAEFEIKGSKDYLESLLQKPITWFAYPNGRWGTDFDQRHCDMVKRLGFEAALSTQWGSAHRGSDRFKLPRFTPWQRTKLKFQAKMLQMRFVRPTFVSS